MPVNPGTQEVGIVRITIWEEDGQEKKPENLSEKSLK
jgi:hypothetical protein